MVQITGAQSKLISANDDGTWKVDKEALYRSDAAGPLTFDAAKDRAVAQARRELLLAVSAHNRAIREKHRPAGWVASLEPDQVKL